MTEKTNILIVGGGKGGAALIELFANSKSVSILGVVDINQDTPGIKLAKKLGIARDSDYKKFISKKELDEIINVTGSAKVQEELVKVSPSGVEVIGGHSAKLMWKLIEERREAEEEWYRTFNGISDFVFMQDKDYTITKVNNAFAKALKAKPEDLIGKKCYQLLHKKDEPWEDCPFEKTRKDHKSHVEEVDDPNIGIPLLVTTSPMFDAKGEFVGSVHLAKDISTQKKAEKIMQKSHDELEKMVKERTKELQKKLDELERFRKATVDREFRMKELQDKVKELEDKSREKR